MLLGGLLSSKATMCFFCCRNSNQLKCSSLIFLENDESLDKTNIFNINDMTCFLRQTLIMLSVPSLLRLFRQPKIYSR